MSGTKYFLDSELRFFSPYLIHRRSESLSPYRFLYFVFCFNQSRGLWVLVHKLIRCFCSVGNIHSGSWGFISRDHRSWGMVCYLPYQTTMMTQSSEFAAALATHFSTLAWKIPGMEDPGRLQSMGSRRVGHDWATSLSLSLLIKSRNSQEERKTKR